MLLVILHIASGSFEMAERFNWEEELFMDDELLRDKVTAVILRTKAYMKALCAQSVALAYLSRFESLSM